MNTLLGKQIFYCSRERRGKIPKQGCLAKLFTEDNMKRQRIKYLNEEEKIKLLSVLRDRKSAERDYLLFSMILNTGLRISELASLSVGHVRSRKTLEILGKGGKIREIPLNKAIREHVEGYLRLKKRNGEGLLDQDPLFVSRNHNRISVRAVQRAMDKWLQEAGIQAKFSPHSLRHTFGTELFSRCKNIRLVQDLMGHSDISTTMIYTHVSKAEMEEAVELLTT